MRNTSSGEILHKEDKSLPSIEDLAGLPPVEFDQALRPLRAYLEQFDEDGSLSQMMLHDNVQHFLFDGMYTRELTIPEGAIIISRVHKRPLVNVISKGHVIVYDSNGKHEYKAPYTFSSPAGTQRIVVAPVESVWVTTHLTDAKSVDEIVDDLTFDNYQEYKHELLCSGCDSSDDSIHLGEAF